MKLNIYDEKRFFDFREIINYSAEKFGNHPAFIIKNIYCKRKMKKRKLVNL